jgi:hypothetical protein
MTELPSMTPEVTLNLPQLTKILNTLESMNLDKHGQHWYTLTQACAFKFGEKPKGISTHTIRTCCALQPRGGIPDAFQSNRKVWEASTIERWCLVTDETLEEYLKEVCPGRMIPERIARALAKHRADGPT